MIVISEAGFARRVPKSNSEPITEQQLSRWKLLSRFIGLLDKHGSQIAPRRREVHGLRNLDRSTDFGLFLFGLFDPVVTSMNALCAATRLNRVSKMLDLERPVASSSFSAAQHVFAPAILEPVLREQLAESLAKQIRSIRAGRFGPEAIQIFDSTVWKVVMLFRWLKWVVPCRHWFAESREGVLIQIYLCLIKTLALKFGRSDCPHLVRLDGP